MYNFHNSYFVNFVNFVSLGFLYFYIYIYIYYTCRSLTRVGLFIYPVPGAPVVIPEKTYMFERPEHTLKISQNMLFEHLEEPPPREISVRCAALRRA